MDHQGSWSGHGDQTETALEITEILENYNRRNGERTGMKVKVLFFGGVALRQYSRLWSGDGHDGLQKELGLSVDSNDQILEAGLYVDPDFHQSYWSVETKHKAASCIVSAIGCIGKSFPSLPRQISFLTPGEPFNDPHYISIKNKSRFGPSAAVCIQIPHPSLFLANCLRLIKMYSDRLDGHITRYEKLQALNRRCAQARLLRLFVDVLDKTGLSNTDSSDAVCPVRLHKQRICENPQDVVEQYLTENVALEAARWEAGIVGRQDGPHSLQDFYAKYAFAFRRIRVWVSKEVRVWEKQPPSCFERFENSVDCFVHGA